MPHVFLKSICRICYRKCRLDNNDIFFLKFPQMHLSEGAFRCLFWLMSPARSYLLIDSLIQVNGAAAQRTRKRSASSAICHVEKAPD